MKYLVASTLLLMPLQAALAQVISFESDVRYKKLEDSKYIDLKSNQNLTLKKGENALILTKTGIPVLVYTPIDTDSTLKITESNLQALMQEQMQTSLNAAANEVVDGIRKVEGLLQKREYQQALVGITQLKGKYPRIATVLFLSGTVQYLSNNKPAAIEDLTAGLIIDPQNAAAQKLLSELKGSSR